jgi:hypothetical protein
MLTDKHNDDRSGRRTRHAGVGLAAMAVVALIGLAGNTAHAAESAQHPAGAVAAVAPDDHRLSPLRAASGVAGAAAPGHPVVDAAPSSATARMPAATKSAYTACFKAAYTSYGRTTWGPFGGRPVYVDVLLNGAAYAMGTVRTGLNGCVTWPLVNGYTYRFRGVSP